MLVNAAEQARFARLERIRDVANSDAAHVGRKWV
jgi:hypothetical protein